MNTVRDDPVKNHAGRAPAREGGSVDTGAEALRLYSERARDLRSEAAHELFGSLWSWVKTRILGGARPARKYGRSDGSECGA